MNVIMIFLQIIIVISILYGIFYLISKRNFFTVKITHWMLLIYVGVLLISIIVTPLMAKNHHAQQKHLIEREIEQNKHLFYEQLRLGKLSAIDDHHLLKYSSFEYDRPTLTLQYTGVEIPQIFIERKATNNPMIETYSMISGLYIDGIDFSHQLGPHKFDLFEDTLTIYSSEKDIIEIAMIKNEFPITQFLGGGIFSQTIQLDEPIIYLVIPQDLEIINGSDLSFEYIKK